MSSLAGCSATFNKGYVSTYDNLTLSITSLSMMATTNIIQITFPSYYQSQYSN